MSFFLFALFQGLLYAQDGVAKQEVRSSEGEPPDDNNFYIPSLPAGDSIKIVHLEKTTEPLVSLWVLATLRPVGNTAENVVL